MTDADPAATARRNRRILEARSKESSAVYDGCMKTTIDIPEDELRDAMRFTRASTKREAVVTVLQEFNRRKRMAELVKYSGTFSDRFPTNDEIEAIDATDPRDLDARRRR
jgi:Arc/MetJ family transcription regulator